jgi:hypothetical protein
MPNWKDKLNGDPVPWLLEPDETQPAIRYFTLRDILGRNENDKEVKAARVAIMASGPVPVILAAQQPEGDWDTPEAIMIMGSKYSATEWALSYMAQFGADGADPRIRAGCEYLLSQYVDRIGSLSYTGTPSGFDCGVGRFGAALIDLGWLSDRRLQTTMEWLAQTIIGEGVSDASKRDTNNRYEKPKNSSPSFACPNNANLPCAWGAIKAMLALNKVPPMQRTRNMNEAIKLGVDFLLSRDPAVADYPFGSGNKPSSIWFKFVYPLDSYADVLQNLEVLAALGKAQNPRLANALEMVISKQNQQGRWLLERTYKDVTNPGTKDPDLQAFRKWYFRIIKDWVDIEKKGQPSKWVTLRALRVLKAAYPEEDLI